MADGSRGPDKYQANAVVVADKLIMMMEQELGPWKRGWNPPDIASMGIPYNATTGKAYRGSNSLTLMIEQQLHGYKEDRWLTFKQAKALGAHVRKGATQTALVKWMDDTRNSKKDEEDGRGQRMFPVVFGAFNAEQIEGLAPAPVREMPAEHERHAHCEELIQATGALIQFDGGNKAFYRPHTDSIHLPERGQFHGDEFYSCLFHELGHWTGHPSRLARDLTGAFGSESYAREELRAEVSALMCGQRLQVGSGSSNHASYLKHWVKILRDTPKEIYAACSDAEKICERLGVAQFEQEITKKLEKEQVLDAPAKVPDPDRSRSREMVMSL